MRQEQGKIACYQNGRLYFAEVALTVLCPAEATSIDVACHGKGFTSQGVVEDVPAVGYEDWKQGALLGIHYALSRCSAPPCSVTVTSIAGLSSDTNPSTVGAAAIQALWSALQYVPSPEEQAHIEQIVLRSAVESWERLPEFGS
jgi:hypothetical protein